MGSKMNLNFLLQNDSPTTTTTLPPLELHKQKLFHQQQQQNQYLSTFHGSPSSARMMELADAAALISKNNLTPYSAVPFSPVSSNSNVSIEERVERLSYPLPSASSSSSPQQQLQNKSNLITTSPNYYNHQKISSTSSTTQQQQQHHRMITTTQVASRSHTCPTCGENFSVKVRFLHHLFTVHQVRNYEARPILPCTRQDCDSAFLRNTDRSKHDMCVHQKLRPHKCDVTNCTSSFFFSKDLIKHKDTVHLRHKPFNCVICFKAFGKREHMTSHVRRVHQKLRPFKCEVCDIRLASKYNLQGHLKTAAHAAAETLARRNDIHSITKQTTQYIRRTV